MLTHGNPPSLGAVAWRARRHALLSNARKSGLCPSKDPRNAPANRRNVGERAEASFTSLADEGAQNALDHQFLTGNQFGILGVLRFQKCLAIFHQEGLEGAFSIYECRHNLSGTRLASV